MPTGPHACAVCSLKATAELQSKQEPRSFNRLPASHSPSFPFTRNVIVHNECVALKLYASLL